MRTVTTTIATLAVLLVSLLLVLTWITQEKQVYDQMTLFRRDLENYRDQCLTTEPREKIEHKTCPLGFVSSLRRRCSQCPAGKFALPRWTACVRYLTCDDLSKDIRLTEHLWAMARWRYMLAEWNSFRLIYAQRITDYGSDSDTSIESVWETATQIAPHDNFLYPVGYCEHTDTLVYSVTEEIYPLTELPTLLRRRGCDSWMVRMKLAMDYVRLLMNLHLHPSGPYTLCNSHTLSILLAQFAISNNFNLILINFDNLPEGHGSILCSRQELTGDFVAPEQTWPYSRYKMFNLDEQLRYSHTSDLWKVPDMTRWLLLVGDEESKRESRDIINYLAHIHHRCKIIDSSLRPSAADILEEYENIWTALVGKPDFL